jgi:hypothetical protein
MLAILFKEQAKSQFLAAIQLNIHNDTDQWSSLYFRKKQEFKR